jgi:hypothetical protein
MDGPADAGCARPLPAARPAAAAAGAAIGDAGMFLTRMEEKMGVLKLIVRRQQAVIDDLQAANARLRAANEQLARAQHTSSTEIARLCKEAADSAERVAELERGGSAPVPPGGPAPKHVVVSATAATSAPRVLGPASLSEENAPATSPQRRPLASRSRRRPAGFAGGEESSERKSPRRGRIVQRGRDGHAAGASTSGSLSGVLNKENGHPREIPSLAGLGARMPHPAASEHSAATSHGSAGESSAASRAMRVASGRQSSRSGGLPAAAIHTIYDSSRAAARYACSLLRSRPFG